MESCTLPPPKYFSNHEDVSITGNIFNLLSTHAYDGEGEVAWPMHLHNFLSMLHEEDEFSDEEASLLLSYALHKSPFCWVISLLTDTVHSFYHFYDIIEETFYHFDPDHLDQKLLQ